MEILWYIGVGLCSLGITYTDLRAFWIPDFLVLFLLALNGAACFYGLVQLNLFFLGIVAAFFLSLYFFFPKSIGSGDVKLVLALSLGCQANSLYTMVLIAFLTATLFAGGLWFWRRQKMIPFAPFLLLGWWSAAFCPWIICL